MKFKIQNRWLLQGVGFSQMSVARLAKMAKVLRLSTDTFEEAVESAIAVLLRGGIVALPTGWCTCFLEKINFFSKVQISFPNALFFKSLFFEENCTNAIFMPWRHLREECTIFFSKDTLYGVSTLIEHSHRLYALKGRPQAKPLGLFLPSAGMCFMDFLNSTFLKFVCKSWAFKIH